MERLESLMGEKLTLSTANAAMTQKAKDDEAKLASLAQEVMSLREIVTKTTNRMQVAMGMPSAMDSLAALSVGDLVKLHATLEGDMGKRYPTGGVGTRGNGEQESSAPVGMGGVMHSALKLSTSR